MSKNERKRPVRLSGIQGNSPGNIEGCYGNENDTKNRHKFNLQFQYVVLKKTVDKLGEVELNCPVNVRHQLTFMGCFLWPIFLPNRKYSLHD
ncbi:hypothetical protein, partial [Peribacillus sp. NPDC056705]|uniref:hypothetical protein n=1 Tax=Peribacillus sp. NPDC056705 TaxID=3345918 RepID=UPI003747CFE4